MFSMNFDQSLNSIGCQDKIKGNISKDIQRFSSLTFLLLLKSFHCLVIGKRK